MVFRDTKDDRSSLHGGSDTETLKETEQASVDPMKLKLVVVLGVVLMFALITLLIDSQQLKMFGVDGVETVQKMNKASRVVTYDSSRVLDHQKSILNNKYGVLLMESDVAYLKHCDMAKMEEAVGGIKSFLAFRDAILHKLQYNKTALKMKVSVKDMKDEITMQSIELFARAVNACDFNLYQPIPTLHSGATGKNDDKASAKEEQRSLEEIRQMVQNLPSYPENETRLVFLISAFADFPQLENLVQNIHLPQHLLVIHLERRTAIDFATSVYKLAESYENIIVLKYSSITYPTDSLSHVFWEIMRLVNDYLDLDYDYLLTMGSSAFPLYEAHEMARYLKSEENRVRIGRMGYPLPRKLCVKHATSVGFTYSRGNAAKQQLDIPQFLVMLQGLSNQINITVPRFSDFNPTRISECRYKTNSGNTAAYNRDTVQQLLHNTDVVDFLSRFKLSGELPSANIRKRFSDIMNLIPIIVSLRPKLGGCCNEEHSWGGALAIAGRIDDIPKPGMMWQGWPCQSSMHNIRLVGPVEGEEMCVSIFDIASHRPRDKAGRRVYGLDQLQEELREARQRGHLFARKFSSDDTYWVEWIKLNLHYSESKGQG